MLKSLPEIVVKSEIYDYIVEWDDAKNEININKHGISFETAAYIFNDENRIEFFDEEHSKDEDRYYTIGKVEDVLFVVYTERGSAIRLISARYATKREEDIYYGSC